MYRIYRSNELLYILTVDLHWTVRLWGWKYYDLFSALTIQSRLNSLCHREGRVSALRVQSGGNQGHVRNSDANSSRARASPDFSQPCRDHRTAEAISVASNMSGIGLDSVAPLGDSGGEKRLRCAAHAMLLLWWNSIGVSHLTLF